MQKHHIFLKTVEEFLRRRYSSKQTVRCYLKEIEYFIQKFDDPYQINLKDIQIRLDEYKDSSRSKQNQLIASLKCLYLDILKRKKFEYKFVRAKRKEYLPTLKSKEEVKEIIDNIPNLKHKAICSLLYGCGLRLDELLSLKLNHILSKQNLVKVVQGKCAKDRFVPLSENLLKLLREYYVKYKPQEYLFEGQSKTTRKYGRGSVGEIVEKYFGKEFHPHLLRHCYGTHLVEAGVELNKIQKLMGHKDIKSTQIYTKTANNLQNLPQLI